MIICPPNQFIFIKIKLTFSERFARGLVLKQRQLARVRFPALRVGYMFLSQVLIGSLDSLSPLRLATLVFVLRTKTLNISLFVNILPSIASTCERSR